MASTNNRNKHLNAFKAGVEKSVNQAKQKTADITPYILGHTGPQTGNLEKIKAAGKGLFIAKPQFTKEESHLLNKFAQAFDAHSRRIKVENPNNHTIHEKNLVRDAHLKAHMLGAFIEHALGTQNPVGRSLLLKVKPEFIEKVGDDVTIKGGFGPQESPQPSVAAPAASPAPNDVKDAVSPDVVPGVQQSTIDSTKPESEEAQIEDKKIAESSPQSGENPVVPIKKEDDVLPSGEAPTTEPPLGDSFMQVEETAPGQPQRPSVPEQKVDPLKGSSQKKSNPKAEVLSDVPARPLEQEKPRIFQAVDSLVQEFDPIKRPLGVEDFNIIIEDFQEEEKKGTIRKEDFPTIIEKLLAKMTEQDQQTIRAELQQRGLS